MEEETQKSSSALKNLGWIVVIAAVVIIAISLVRPDGIAIRNQQAYHAVFLDNNQVYFGRLAGENDDFVSLTNVYYLRAGSVQQPGQEPSTQIDLVKLGAELHAPRDEMLINKDHILFYEEIREDGGVMQLIREHQGNE